MYLTVHFGRVKPTSKMDDEMRALREELKGKEGVISMMKEKTRMFVTKMKQDHEAALGAMESELQKTKSLLELANGRMEELVVSSGAANRINPLNG